MGNTSPTPRALFVEAMIFWSVGLVIYVGRMYVVSPSFKPVAMLTAAQDLTSDFKWRNQALILYGPFLLQLYYQWLTTNTGVQGTIM